MHDVFSISAHFVLIVNTILYLKWFSKHEKPFKVLAIYLLIINIIQSISTVLYHLVEDNTQYSHFYFLLQFLILSYFFTLIFENLILKRIVRLIVAVVLVTLAIQYSLNPSIFFTFNLLEIIICSAPLIVYSFLYFMYTLEKTSKKYIYVNSGIFLYLLCSTLIFVAGNYVIDTETFWFKFVWIVNAFLYLIYQILVFIEWYKHFRKSEVIQ